MRAVTEREDARVPAVDVELVGAIELARVAVPRTEEQRDLLPLGDRPRRASRRRAWWSASCTAWGSCSAAALRRPAPSAPGRRSRASRWSGCDANSRTPLAISLAVVSCPPEISSRQKPMICASVSFSPSSSTSTSRLRMSSVGSRAAQRHELADSAIRLPAAASLSAGCPSRRRRGRGMVGPHADVVVLFGRDAEHRGDHRCREQCREVAHHVELGAAVETVESVRSTRGLWARAQRCGEA